MTTRPAVTLVVLSEDRGREGWSSLHRLVRRTLDLVVSGLDWQAGVEIAPRSDVPPEVQRICAGNLWRSTNPADLPRRGALFRYVARLLDEGEGRPQFVLFHVDADRIWSSPTRARSLNHQQFTAVVETGVRRALVERSKTPRESSQVDRLMKRLSVIEPHYSIEAWLYQATGRARELCLARRCAGRHVPRYDEWERDRGALDEIERLKDQGPHRDLHCLGDDDKDHLARGFPAEAVFDAGKSYAAWVEMLMADAALMAALRGARYPDQ